MTISRDQALRELADAVRDVFPGDALFDSYDNEPSIRIRLGHRRKPIYLLLSDIELRGYIDGEALVREQARTAIHRACELQFSEYDAHEDPIQRPFIIDALVELKVTHR